MYISIAENCSLGHAPSHETGRVHYKKVMLINRFVDGLESQAGRSIPGQSQVDWL